MHSDELQNIARKLFAVSPLKQRKLAMLQRFMLKPLGKRSLDLGSDNGVVSLKLRELGGEWSSADLIPETVEAIRLLVTERVFLIKEPTLPFSEASFDQVLIVDLLEHLEKDRSCIQEIWRILVPQGVLVVNVPNPKEGLFSRIRFFLGQTDLGVLTVCDQVNPASHILSTSAGVNSNHSPFILLDANLS